MKVKTTRISIIFKVFFVLITSIVFSTPALADVIIDNGDSGTSSTGTWKVSGGSNPYGTNSLFARPSATFTWQFSGQPAGDYEVLMWWTTYASRGTNISVDIHAAATSSVTVNQQENGGQWNSLGTFTFGASGSVTITASGDVQADGTTIVSTCADAVRFRKVSDNSAPTAFIDGISPNPASGGETVSFSGRGEDSDGTITAFSWTSNLDGQLSSEASFSTSALSIGTHEINFSVQDDQGAWSTSATQTLTVSDPQVDFIVDNGDAGTSSTGTWNVSSGSSPYGTNSLFARPSATYTWQFSGQPAGDYEVLMWWTTYASRGTDISVDINAAATSSVTVNQQENGGQWNSLGTFTFGTSGSVTITASGDVQANGNTVSTCADAVRFRKILSDADRVSNGLVVYYPFTEGAGSTLGDQSNNGAALDLEISGAVTWLADSTGVEFAGGRIGTGAPADKIINALSASGASTFEVWALPANLTQSGPVRLISVGADTSNQNYMLGQTGSNYQVRLLHTAKDAKAQPRLETSGGVATAVQHIVHTYDGTTERLYINGVQRPETVSLPGNYSNWDTTDLFSIGNEAGSDRSFYGRVYLVAVYDRALSPAEVQQNFAAGHDGTPATNPAPRIDAIDNVTINENDTKTVALSASGPDGHSLSFSSPDLPGFATLNHLAGNNAEIVLSPTNTDIGTYDVTVVVTDDATTPLSGQTTFTITVDASNPRVSDGLIVYYPFTEGAGSTLGDQSDNGAALNLEISGAVTWLADSTGVEFAGGRIGTSAPADKIINALSAGGASTFEIWALPDNLTQSGPVRLISVGADTSNQNFMLGQTGSNYQVRLLHTAKDAKAQPRLETSGGVATAVQHIVHTYDGTTERLYINGVQRPETVSLPGNYSNWDTTDLFSIGNEAGSDRPFHGKVYLVAVYDRALSPAEVQQNFDAGKEASTGSNDPGTGGSDLVLKDITIVDARTYDSDAGIIFDHVVMTATADVVAAATFELVLRPGTRIVRGARFVARMKDNDGLSNRCELQYFGDLNQGPEGDFDGDGYTNLQECRMGTDPSFPEDIEDRDKDGLPDYWELQHFENLEDCDCSTDNNGDGVHDCMEYRLGRDPNATGSKGPGIYYQYDKLGRTIKIERIPSR